VNYVDINSDFLVFDGALVEMESWNDSAPGPILTSNVAPRKRTTRMKTSKVTFLGLNILEMFIFY
jgi:hypothetical protein